MSARHYIPLLYRPFERTIECAKHEGTANVVLWFDEAHKGGYKWRYFTRAFTRPPSDFWTQVITCLEDHFGLPKGSDLSILCTPPGKLVARGQAHAALFDRTYVTPTGLSHTHHLVQAAGDEAADSVVLPFPNRRGTCVGE